MAPLNRRLGTRLYGIEVQVDADDQIYVQFRGVRISDIAKYFLGEIGLELGQWDITHYTALERFLVLTPLDAYRLAEAFGWEGQGQIKRKTYLLRDVSFPVVTPSGLRRTVKLCLYRVRDGATTAYKLEASILNESKHTRQLKPEDAVALDDVLQAIVQEHAVTPQPKPKRWEPQVEGDEVQRDPRYARLPAKAYRGSPPSQEARNAVSLYGCFDVALGVVEPHFPPDQRPPGALGDQVEDTPHPSNPSVPLPSTEDSREKEAKLDHDDDFPDLSFPVEEVPAEDAHRSRRTGTIPKRGRTRVTYRRVARELLLRKGYFSEVILNPEADPVPFIQELLDVRGPRESVAVGAWGCDDGHGRPIGVPAHLANIRGVSVWGQADLHIVYVDPSITTCVSDAVMGFNLEERIDSDGVVRPAGWDPGPLAPAEGLAGSDEMAPYVRAVGALLWEALTDIRRTCESSGHSFVLVTSDARSEKARHRQRLTYHDYRRDFQVRSLIGDAGRHAAHLRFLVGHGRAILIKDEAEGRIGRGPMVA